MGKVLGLGGFWIVAVIIASFMPPGAGHVIGTLAVYIVIAGLGSIILSWFLGGDGFDHLLAGACMAIPGWALVHFAFGFSLLSPELACARSSNCNAVGDFILIMIANLIMVGIGMAIVALPTIPLMMKFKKDNQPRH
jgi:hypothetical protein